MNFLNINMNVPVNAQDIYVWIIEMVPWLVKEGKRRQGLGKVHERYEVPGANFV